MSKITHFNVDQMAERFMRYASVFTQSEEGVADTPSTDCQRDLGRMLTNELTDMGAADVYFDEAKCYVYATIPASIPADPEAVSRLKDGAKKRRENGAPILGLVAHMDTSNAVDAKDHPFVHPRKIENYDGGRILLHEKEGYAMDAEAFPDLARHKGQTLIVTDGTTVLGGDDKAGVTQIMEAAAFYLAHPEFPHGTIRIMITPDEEVGNGTMNMDLNHFAVDYAYTVDGSGVGDLEYENFNAASADIEIAGLSTHPGDAKGVMRNALLVAMEFNSMLPQNETPYHTEMYEGFYHLDEMKGTTDHATMNYIIRDHDREIFENRKKKVQEITDALNHKYGEGVVSLTLKDSYYNMAEKIKPHMHLIDNAKEAMDKVDVKPHITPIRGGTDGAAMSFKGIPCPNLGTGAYNYHSRYEYVVAEEMALGAEILLRILGKYAEYAVNA